VCDVVAVGGALEPGGGTAIGAVESLLTFSCFRKGAESRHRQGACGTPSSPIWRSEPDGAPVLFLGLGKKTRDRKPNPNNPRPEPKKPIFRGSVCISGTGSSKPNKIPKNRVLSSVNRTDRTVQRVTNKGPSGQSGSLGLTAFRRSPTRQRQRQVGSHQGAITHVRLWVAAGPPPTTTRLPVQNSSE
jgi:hypothetical protein